MEVNRDINMNNSVVLQYINLTIAEHPHLRYSPNIIVLIYVDPPVFRPPFSLWHSAHQHHLFKFLPADVT